MAMWADDNVAMASRVTLNQAASTLMAEVQLRLENRARWGAYIWIRLQWGRHYFITPHYTEQAAPESGVTSNTPFYVNQLL